MFEESFKLHFLKALVINDSPFVLCYFWKDESIFSSDYRRCFVLLPQNMFSKREHKIIDLVEYLVSFPLAKILYSTPDVVEKSFLNDSNK